MGIEIEAEVKTAIRIALVEFVFTEVKFYLPIDTNIEEFADIVIDYIAYETTDDRAMDLAEEIEESFEFGLG